VVDTEPPLGHFYCGRYDLLLAPLWGDGERIAPFIALCPNERASNASPWRTCFVQAKDEEMRDFRDAKAMAHTLRLALAAKDHKVTISQSLELIAVAFGVPDWNSLSAAIRTGATGSSKNASPTSAKAQGAPSLVFSPVLEATLRRAFAYANQRKHEYAMLEHLLLSLIDDPDASAVMKACEVDLGALNETLTTYVNACGNLVRDDGKESKPSPAFERVTNRRAVIAAINAQGLGPYIVTGAHVLVSIFPEHRSRAAKSLGEQAVTLTDAENFILHGAVKGAGDAQISQH
jgi:hypothetical protein